MSQTTKTLPTLSELAALERTGRLSELTRTRATYNRSKLFILRDEKLRIASSLLLSGDFLTRRAGRVKVEEMIERMRKMSRQCNSAGDYLGDLLALYMVSSAQGVLGNVLQQNALNKNLLALLERFAEMNRHYAHDPDLLFVKAKLLFTLIKHDSDFAGGYPVSDVVDFVLSMEERRHPDFPGAALALVRMSRQWCVPDEHILILLRALRCDFGWPDLIAEVERYFAWREL